MDELYNLGLGELYQRACRALLRVPDVRLTVALSSDDPKRALMNLIVGSTALASTGMPFVARDITTAVVDRPSTEHVVSDAVSFGTRVWQSIRMIAQRSVAQSHTHNAEATLNRVLDELEHHALRREAARRAEQALPTMQFEIVKSKLAMPHKSLAPAESCSCLLSCIEHGREQARVAQGKHILVVLGNTGAGKSAFVNLLHGCTFELNSEDRMAVREDSPVKELVKIGHTNKSETYTPIVENACDSVGEGYAFADCPGFLDNRGFEINIANAVNVKQTLVAASSVLVVVIINYSSLMADRGKGVKDLFHILSSLFGTLENVKKHANSVLLAISQAPITHPETGGKMTLDRYKQKLLDPSGLDELATEFLNALKDANILIYHLLDRGDASWLRRDGIITRIKGLTPITEPGDLFQSVISDGDKESLRNLVSGLSTELGKAIDAGEFGRVSDMASDLLELKKVGHEFLNAVIDDVFSDIMQYRMTTVRTILDERSELNLQECTGQEDAQLFNKTRGELRNLSFLLAAFAGIKELREQLRELLVEATCQMETLVKRAAEDRGRKAVEESLREVLRRVGENVVREVLELPKAADAMKVKHQDEYTGMRDFQVAEINTLLDPTASNEVMELQERHEDQLQELAYRVKEADGLWQRHISHVAAKLDQRDENILAEASGDFWEKVGWSSAQLCSETKPVNWVGKKLSASDCEVMATVLRKLKGPPCLRVLFLSSNPIGDAGLTALSDATRLGALASLEKLHINNIKIGDAGLAELSNVLADGSLEQLMFLDVNGNQIGDVGVKALASAITQGALANLETLYLHSNTIGDTGTAAFASSLVSSGALAKLERLWLNGNRVGNAGMKALCEMFAQGGLTSLKKLQLEDNPGMHQQVLEALQTRTARA
eukprot:TRINITY_DN42573_c0_g1_i1.p1 TRINITY_DN42573_c0_g1~~TRINITY_DN42573_c0_g1_i1.p1  ORF type:complete len:908 (+),score=197.81 TRINITY_DN42573_c0_g1_i1:33-2726(+)